MRNFLVCDGGGTKTDFFIFNEKAEILSYYKNAGTNVLFIDEEKAINNAVEGINERVEKARLSTKDLELVCLFIPGFENRIREIRKRISMKNTKCLPDVNSAFFGAMGRSYGIVVLNGTGSFAVGTSKDSRKVVSGGRGPLAGDKGNGYYIGIMYLEKPVYFYDNDIKDSKLRKIFLEKFGIEDEYKIREIAYFSDFGREDIAKIPKIAAEVVEENDKGAIDVLRRAAKELVESVITLNRKLNYGKLPVSLIGGVTSIGDLFINIFKEELLVKCRNSYYENPKYDPLIGATLHVLLKEASIDIERDKEVLSNPSKYRRD